MLSPASCDVFLLEFLQSIDELKKISNADMSFVRCSQEGLYFIIKSKYENRVQHLKLHSETLKYFDNEVNPSVKPRFLSKEEWNNIWDLIHFSEYKLAVGKCFNRCLPQEAAALSLFLHPGELSRINDPFYIDNDEVKERTYAPNNPTYNRAYKNWIIKQASKNLPFILKKFSCYDVLNLDNIFLPNSICFIAKLSNSLMLMRSGSKLIGSISPRLN